MLRVCVAIIVVVTQATRTYTTITRTPQHFGAVRLNRFLLPAI